MLTLHELNNLTLVTKESNSTQNGKKIYREDAKDAKNVKTKKDFCVIQVFLATLADFLSGRFSFIGHSGSNVKSGLTGLG